MPNNHCTFLELSSYKACRIIQIDEFYGFLFLFPCVFHFIYMIIKLILKITFTFNPHLKFIC